jgi:hypothetical protein
MSRHFAHTAGRRRIRAAATATLLLVAGLFASSVGAAPSGAATQPQLVMSVSTANTGLTGTLGAPGDALPTVLTAKNTATIKIVISVSDNTDLTKGTVINLTALHSATAGPLGKFDPGSVTVTTKGPSATFFVSYTEAEDGVTLRAALKKTTSTSPLPVDSAPFDVLDTLKLTPKTDPSLTTGLGAEDCNSRTNVSVCGVVVLPDGIGSEQAALSTGVCTGGLCTGGKEVQFIAGLKKLGPDGQTLVNIYSRTHPATLILQCDKSKCGGKGVSSYTAKVALTKDGALSPSPPCATKGVIQDEPGVEFCTDYVSSHRDNAGDVLLHVLFFTDMRGTI